MGIFRLNCIKMDLNSHDKILAATNHLPHVISFSLMRYIEKSSNIKNKVLMGGGLKDFTRISSSDPEMWSDIFDLNKKEILNSIKGFKKELEVMEKNILNSRSKTKNLIAESIRQEKKLLIDNIIKVIKEKNLSGEVVIPGDKSISQDNLIWTFTKEKRKFTLTK